MIHTDIHTNATTYIQSVTSRWCAPVSPPMTTMKGLIASEEVMTALATPTLAALVNEGCVFSSKANVIPAAVWSIVMRHSRCCRVPPVPAIWPRPHTHIREEAPQLEVQSSERNAATAMMLNEHKLKTCQHVRAYIPTYTRTANRNNPFHLKKKCRMMARMASTCGRITVMLVRARGRYTHTLHTHRQTL
jgi:hypothetical protein